MADVSSAVNLFWVFNLAVSNCITSALSCASSSKSSFVDLDSAFSCSLACKRNLAAAISLDVISSSTLPASFNASNLCSTDIFSLSAACSLNSAMRLFASALSTNNCLSALSAFARASASSPATFISLRVSSAKFLIPSVTSLTLVLSSPHASDAPFKSPLASLTSALPAANMPSPKLAIISVTLPTTTPICVIIRVNLF